jgi:hypothetical protein
MSVAAMNEYFRLIDDWLAGQYGGPSRGPRTPNVTEHVGSHM